MPRSHPHGGPCARRLLLALLAALWLFAAGCGSSNSGTPEKVGPAPKSRTPK